MILDSSAIVAVLLAEPGCDALVARIAEAEVVGVGSPTLVETGLVLSAKLGLTGKVLVARFAQEARLEIVAFGAEHWSAAVDAFLRFGKGRHPAALNFGDCMTYATARLSAQPLLCVGDDFARTDLALVD